MPPVVINEPLKTHSYIDAVTGETIYRSHLSKTGLTGASQTPPGSIPMPANRFDSFDKTASKQPNMRCLGWRSSYIDALTGTKTVRNAYSWLTYAQARSFAIQFGSGLAQLGLAKQHMFGIYSINNKEWDIADLGCACYGYVSVTLYDTFGVDAISHIISHTRCSVVALTADKVAKLLDVHRQGGCESLKHLIVMDEWYDQEQHEVEYWETEEDLVNKQEALKKEPLTPVQLEVINTTRTSHEQLRHLAEQQGITVHSFRSILQLGRRFPATPLPPSLDDLSTICFTSGTTGTPKGACLSHRNLLSVAMSSIQLGETSVRVQVGGKPMMRSGHTNGGRFRPGDVLISYLPLAHMFERIVHCIALLVGMSIGYYSGNVFQLTDDCKLLRPTMFCSVPRLLNKIQSAVLANVERLGGVQKWLFQKCYNAKKRNLTTKNTVTHCVYDALVFRKIQNLLGGRVREMITGSAPLSPGTMEFLRVVFSCDVLEGYGQTESSAASFLTIPGDHTSTGNVGAVLPCCEFKLVSVTDMNYFVTDHPCPRGEVWVRGPSVFLGYYGDSEMEKTMETVDAQGWLHSGDVGRVNADGSLSIIDRAKNMFKMSQGEYVAPERVENVYASCSHMAGVWVYGDSYQHQCVAIVVLDPVKYPVDNGTSNTRCGSTMETQQNNQDTPVTQLPTGGGSTHPPTVSRSSATDQPVAIGCDAAENVLKDGLPGSTPVANRESVTKQILAELIALGENSALSSFEQVAAIHVVHELFTMDNNQLTPTFKLKRQVLKQVYQPVIDALYERLGKENTVYEAAQAEKRAREPQQPRSKPALRATSASGATTTLVQVAAQSKPAPVQPINVFTHDQPS